MTCGGSRARAQALTSADEKLAQIWLKDSRDSFVTMIRDKQSLAAEEAKSTVGDAVLCLVPSRSVVWVCRHPIVQVIWCDFVGRAAGSVHVRSCQTRTDLPQSRTGCATTRGSCRGIDRRRSLSCRRPNRCQETDKMAPLRGSAAGDLSTPSPQGARTVAQPDELIDFHHLKARKGMTQLEIEDEVATDLQRATGIADASLDSTRLNRVLQLTGEEALCPCAGLSRVARRRRPSGAYLPQNGMSCVAVVMRCGVAELHTWGSDAPHAAMRRCRHPSSNC